MLRMRFICDSTEKTEKAFFALAFLRAAFEREKMNEIENVEDILNSLDISQDLEYCHQLLKMHHIDL